MKTSRNRLNRRAFLYAAGTAGVALPFLEGMPERSAFAQSESPVFGLFICTANGVVQQYANEPERFWPTQTGALTTANMSASASERATGILAEHADKLLIVRGVNYPQTGSNGCGHAQGLVHCLTANGATGSGNTMTSTAVSADTVIADGVNPGGVDPMTLYSGMKGGYIDEKLSFSAPGQVRAAEGNPYNVYQRMVGLLDQNGDPTPMADNLALKRKSVNDLVRDQIKSLQSNSALSQADRERLDQHFTSIRDLETNMTEMGASCTGEFLDVAALEAMNSGNAFRQDGAIEDVAKLQMELVALAFACNQTRVATLQIGDGTDGTRYTINGQRVERFHWVSHRIQSDGSTGAAIPEALEWHTAIDRIRMETFKHLIDRWSMYNVGNGSLLDNAFAYWTSHVAQGPSHSFNNVPVVIAGNAGGFLRTGQYIDAGGTSNSRLLNTLITANGVPTENFGTGGTGLINEMLA